MPGKKSFWLGVFERLFLEWSWIRTMGPGNYVALQRGAQEVIRLDQSGSRLALAWEGSDPIFSLPGIPLARQYQQGELAWFPAAFRSWSPVDGWQAAGIAHWFLVLLFLIAWLAFLAWRWRRMEVAGSGRG